MTASLRSDAVARGGRWTLRRSRRGVPTHRTTRQALPRLGQRLDIARAALVVVCTVSISLLVHLAVVSGAQAGAAQQQSYDVLRGQLAAGTAPIGPTDDTGALLAAGTPVAYLEIPAIGLRQVVGEGTSANVLFDGPGHRRDTPLPGQIGTSVLFGRHAAYGGPFGRITELTAGDRITVTTGQGVFDYRVTGVRYEGDPAPPRLEPGGSRLVLATAAGRAFMPTGVVRIDASLDDTAVVGPARAISAAGLPEQERLMATDSRTLWALALWLQALLAVAIGAVWSWHRWGRPQTWLVFIPILLLVGVSVAGEVARLLPNVL